MSGWQDSNLRPPAPKAGAMTGLRYIPFVCVFYNFFQKQFARFLLIDNKCENTSGIL